jgi:hypothetical protein
MVCTSSIEGVDEDEDNEGEGEEEDEGKRVVAMDEG